MGAGANETGLEELRVQVVAVSGEVGAALHALAEKHGTVQEYIKRWSKLDPRSASTEPYTLAISQHVSPNHSCQLQTCTALQGSREGNLLQIQGAYMYISPCRQPHWQGDIIARRQGDAERSNIRAQDFHLLSLF